MELEPIQEKAVVIAIQLLAEKINSGTRSEDALKYTQAALNLAHVLAVNANIINLKKEI